MNTTARNCPGKPDTGEEGGAAGPGEQPAAGMAELATIERALAYSAARSDIEVHCRGAGHWRDRWYDPSDVSTPADDREFIATALRYLDLRGLLERHENGVWVRVREEDDPLAIDAGKVAA